MTDSVRNQLAETGQPFILIRANGLPGTENFDLDVQAGCGIDSTDDLVALMLLVVEQITGVSTSLYIQEVDIARSAARRAAS